MSRVLLLLLALSAALLPAAGEADGAAAIHVCKSSDLRYSFSRGGPKDFGVFKLDIQGGVCSTAHRVARAWMKKFERNLHDGSERRPRSAGGFTFKSLPTKRPQTFRERGQRNLTTIDFEYRVPNG